MRRSALALVLLSLVASPAAAVHLPPPNTLFESVEKAWVVGAAKLGKPLTYRGGRLLLFPAQISDIVYAPAGKPRNLMLVYEVPADEVEAPFFRQDEEIFAPIRLLPEHSYYKDNLPTTRRHQVLGGRRNVFRAEEAAEARRIVAKWVAAIETSGKERWAARAAALCEALNSSVPRIGEDAVNYLATDKRFSAGLHEALRDPVGRFLAGPSAPEIKVRLLETLGRAKATVLEDEIARVAAGDDEVAAAALRALEDLGKPATTERLLELSRANGEQVRSYAAFGLGARAGQEQAALARAKEILASDAEVDAVRLAAARGFGESRAGEAVAPLDLAVRAGDAVSREAAMALAAIGTPEAIESLRHALVEGRGEQAAAGAAGLARVPACSACAEILREQRQEHPEEAVRDLIGIALEVPLEHRH